jgi:hypothetical protein
MTRARLPGGPFGARSASASAPAGRRPATHAAGHQVERDAGQLARAAMERPLAAPAAPAAPAQAQPATAGGAGMDPALRGEMEQRFGVDFANVKVHADTAAGREARNLNADAFSHGNDLYFGAGRYAPTSAAGRELIAHELAHVVQRASGTPDPAAQALTRQVLQSIDVTKADDGVLRQRAHALSTWFGEHLIDDPDYAINLSQAEDIFREMQSRAGAAASDADLEALRARLIARSPRSVFEQKIMRGELPQFKGVSDETGAVVGYRRESGGYWELVDVEGNFVRSGEKPLETPLLDPIDLIPFELLGSLALKAAMLGARGLLRFGARQLGRSAATVVADDSARLAAKAGAGQWTNVASGAAGKVAVKEGGELGAKALAQVFRRGDKLSSVAAVSLKRLRNVLGRAGASPGEYKLVKVSKEAAEQLEKEVGSAVWGWVEKNGAGAVVRDAKGRPVIHFTPRALASLEQAVKTFGHEAKHIKDFAAGLKTSSEALAEKEGEKLWLVVVETLAK